MSELLTEHEIQISMASPNRPNQLSKNSEAVRLLREKFECNEITGDETPKQAWLMDPLFQQYKLENFRTCYNNMKKEYQSGSSNCQYYLSSCLIFILFYFLSERTDSIFIVKKLQ